MVKGCLEATKKHRIYDKISKEFYRKGDVFLNRKERRSKNKEINILEETIKNIAQICRVELDEIPHCDTISDVLKNIKPEEIEKIRKYMINKLIRSKMLEKYKIRNKYYHIVFDGTGLATSRKKYNKN